MNIFIIKRELAELETKKAWDKMIEYLYGKWKEQKDSPELSILLIEEMFWAITEGENLNTGCYENAMWTGIEKYDCTCESIFKESVDSGLRLCQHDILFLWRLSHISSLAPYMFCDLCNKYFPDCTYRNCSMYLLQRAISLSPKSYILDFEMKTGRERLSLDNTYLVELKRELRELHLQNNIVDVQILYEFNNII